MLTSYLHVEECRSVDIVERHKTSEVNSSSCRTLEDLSYFKEFRLFVWKSAEEKFAQGHQYDISSLGNGVGAISTDV